MHSKTLLVYPIDSDELNWKVGGLVVRAGREGLAVDVAVFVHVDRTPGVF